MRKKDFKPLKDLEFYKQCRLFRMEITALVKEKFPKEEKYRLGDQIIRSSRSITANIAEGHGRFYYQDNIKFCRYARGSLEETLEHLVTAFDENYISQKELKTFHEKYSNCKRLCNGYIAYLRRSKLGEDTKGTTTND